MTDIKITPLSADQVPAAFELATRTFLQSSTMHQALHVTLEEYQAYLRPGFDALVAEGLSSGATDTSSGKLVGCMIVGDYYPCLRARGAVSGKFSPLVGITRKLRSRFEKQHVVRSGQIALVDMGAVDPIAAGKGVYQALRQRTHRLVQSRGFAKIAGELSSAATQHVVIEKLGHVPVARQSFQDYTHEGQRPFLHITQPRDYVLAIGDL